jgi:hypothetical protein
MLFICLYLFIIFYKLIAEISHKPDQVTKILIFSIFLGNSESMRKRYLLFVAVLFFRIIPVSGQYYNTGTDPATLKWMQIKSDNYTLIFPESYTRTALEYAHSLDMSVSKLSIFYKVKKIRIPIIVHNYTTFSNGYVAWAPRRMELYPTPEQNTVPLDPVEQLSLHEMTHVMQMRSLNKGFTKAMTYVIGEQATGLVSSLAPLWFLEGDAVLAESYLTGSGRGRSPSFQKQMKAITLEEKKLYGYDKMVHGSYRRNIPDHYQFGYQMVAWATANKGHQLWNNTLDYIGRYPFSIVPVNISLSKDAGLIKSRLYNQTFDSLRVIWEKNIISSGAHSYEPLNKPKKKEFINYYSPVVAGTDSIIVIKTSMFSPAAFVLIDLVNKSEKRIYTPGEIYPWVISGAKGKIAWVEQLPDPRWENRDYSVVKILEIKNKKVIQLSRRSRYLSAALSPDGRFVAAAENTIDNNNNLVILDAFNGDILKSVQIPGNFYPQKPCWSSTGKEITLISLSAKGEGVFSFNINDEKWKTLIEPSFDDLQSAFLSNDSLYFVSSSSGTENIWLLTPGGQRMMISGSKYGAIDPVVYGSKIFFADYSLSGNNLSRIDLNVDKLPGHSDYQKTSFIVNRFDSVKNTPPALMTDYNPVPYKKWKHPFRFHSWMPFYADIDEIQSDPTAIKPGVSIMSQNDLSTLITTVGYEYSDGRNLIHTKIRWQGWLPVLESRFDYGYAPFISKLNNTVGDPSETNPGMIFTNTLSIPLNFSTGRFYQYLYTSLSASYNNRYIYLKETGNYDYGQTMLTERIYVSNIHKSAKRDIYPRWGQIFDYSFSSFPADKDIYGSLSTLRTALYFPGFIRNHGIKLRFEYDLQDPVKLLYNNKASLPRGYFNIISLDYKLYSADYVLPVVYPDFTIPGLLYVKRIRMGLFYDYATGDGNYYLDRTADRFHDYAEIFRSYGTELLADFHVLRIPFLISAGVQVAWKDPGQAPVYQGLFRIDVYGLKVGKQRY